MCEKKYFYGAKNWRRKGDLKEFSFFFTFSLVPSIVHKILGECNELENDVKMLTKLLNETMMTDVMELKKRPRLTRKNNMIDHEYP